MTFVKRSKDSKRFSIIVSVLIIVVITLTGIYWFLTNNPRTIFFNSLNAFFEEVAEGFDWKNDITKGSVVVNYRENGKTFLSNYTFTYDKKNKILKALDTSNNIRFYYENGKSYIYDPDITNKYILLNGSFEGLLNIKAAIGEFGQSFNEALEMQKLTKTNETIQVDGKDVNMVLTQLVLNENNFNKVVSNLETSLKTKDNFNMFYETLFDHYNIGNDLMLKLYNDKADHSILKIEMYTDNFMFDITKNKNVYDYIIRLNDSQIIGNFKIDNNSVSITNEKSDLYTNITFNYEKTLNIDKEDITDFVTIDSLSETERNLMNEKLGSNPLLKNIIK
ncbi:MAG: hypothetical protein IJ093_04790, partial [Bacilli bacterium]|nr:hypothetical protein [Bacilli bacterium]